YPGGSGNRSWLLIKHRDDWAGDVDITEFAPKSVKSEGDFEDILAQDRPDVWTSHRPAPAKGGEAGAMLAKIIERAAAIKAGQAPAPSPRRRAARPAPSRASGSTKAAKATGTRKNTRPRTTTSVRNKTGVKR